MSKSKPWYIDCKNSELLLNKLSGFFTKQQELARDLQAAKSLGICKTSTSVNRHKDFRSLDSILKNGNGTTKICTTPTRKDPEEAT